MTDLTLRKAEPKDEATILVLWSELSTYYQALKPTLPAKWSGPPLPERRTRQLQLLWEDPDNHVGFIAESNQIVAGFCRAELSVDASVGSSIHTLVVNADFRGRGVGKMLMTAAMDWCRSHGANEVALDVLPVNVNAAQFHEALGFRPYLTSYLKRL